MKTLTVLALTVLLFAGCATMPTQKEILSADYGSRPADYQDIIKRYLSGTLYDPYTAQYSRWLSPDPAWYKGFMSKQILYGYRVCVFVNAKNQLGGYTGGKLHLFMIKEGRVIAHEGGNYRPGTYGESDVYKKCGY